jgi:hypothetical protein
MVSALRKQIRVISDSSPIPAAPPERRPASAFSRRAKQNFVGEPTQSCLDSLDFAGFLAENRCPLFGNPA